MLVASDDKRRGEQGRPNVEAMQPSVVTESNYSDRKVTVVGRPDGVFTSVTRTDGASSTQEYQGKPSQNEDNVPDAVHRLADKLNADEKARVWRERGPKPDEHISIDGVLEHEDGSTKKECQAVRVETGTLGERARHGQATSSYGESELVAQVVAAVEHKQTAADSTMVLVLDANEAPAYTDDPEVITQVQAELKTRGLTGAWSEIWLIGPTTGRTTQIDPP